MSNIREYRIVVLGGGGVGKSALTIRLVTNNFLEEYDPTIEDSYRKQVSIDGSPALLDILDTAGQEEFASMRDMWMREGEAFGFVYSITDSCTFDEIEALAIHLERIFDWDRDDNEKFALSDPETIKPFIIIGNKCDLENQRRVSYEQGKALADEWGVPFFETSAKDKINNEEIFYEMVRQSRRWRNGSKNGPNTSASKIKKNNKNIINPFKCVAMVLCCSCICIYMLLQRIFNCIANNIKCCRAREQLRKQVMTQKKLQIDEKIKRKKQRLRFFAVDKLPPDHVPDPILSLKNFKIRRQFDFKRCFIAIICGLCLPVVVTVQTIAFITYHFKQTVSWYPDKYKYGYIHHSLLLDFIGMMVGREPLQDPEAVNDKNWFLRQSRLQIFERIVAVIIITTCLVICYMNALQYSNNSVSIMETIGPLSLYWISWLLLSIWIGYEPVLYPKLPYLPRLRSIQLFFGETFTHRTDAYKFLRAYASSRDHKWALSYKQIIVIVLLALLYALIPGITRATVGDDSDNLDRFRFWTKKDLFIESTACIINFLFVAAFIYAIEAQYSKHFDNYKEWMNDLTKLLSKEEMQQINEDDAQRTNHLTPEAGAKFSNSLFLSLTRRSNALGWIEIRSYLAIEGKLLFGQQEIPTLWLLIVTIFLTLFLLYRVFFIDGNALHSVLFNGIATLNVICILSLARIAITGYQFEKLQYMQEKLISEQKFYMRCKLSDKNQPQPPFKPKQEPKPIQSSKTKPIIKSTVQSNHNAGEKKQEEAEEKKDPETDNQDDDNDNVEMKDIETEENSQYDEETEEEEEEKMQLITTSKETKKTEPPKTLSMHSPKQNDFNKEETELTVFIPKDKNEQISNKIDNINWISYNFGFIDDLQDIVQKKDIFPRLFKIKLNSVLAKAMAGIVFTTVVTAIKIFIQ